jgi:AcrR family transcriptional regulator
VQQEEDGFVLVLAPDRDPLLDAADLGEEALVDTLRSLNRQRGCIAVPPDQQGCEASCSGQQRSQGRHDRDPPECSHEFLPWIRDHGSELLCRPATCPLWRARQNIRLHNILAYTLEMPPPKRARKAPLKIAAVPADRPSGGKRARTRARLIEAAAELMMEVGCEATTLEGVAARIGMTRGAVYSSFTSRDDLFLAVFSACFKPVNPAFRRGAALKEQMRLLGTAVAETIHASEQHPNLMAEFQLFVQRHEALRARLARYTADAVRCYAASWLEYLPAEELPMRPDHFIIVVDALIDGLLAQYAITPELITEELVISAFEALA